MGCRAYLDGLSPFHVERSRLFGILVAVACSCRGRAASRIDVRRGTKVLYVRLVLRRNGGSAARFEATQTILIARSSGLTVLSLNGSIA